MTRPSSKQRARARRRLEETTPLRTHPEYIRLERAAAALPEQGPVADLVGEIHAELSRLVLIESGSHEARPYLHAFGKRAHELTGSVDGMRAIAFKAAGLDRRAAGIRRDMLDKSWDRIGDERGCWCA